MTFEKQATTGGMTPQIKGFVLTFLGVLFVVPDSLFVRLIAADALMIAFWRLTGAGLLIALGLLVWQGTAPFRAVLRTGRVGLIYGLCMGLSGFFFVLAVVNTSVANVVFIIASMPVFAGLSIIAYGSGGTKGAYLTGDLMALGVSAIFAGGLTAARRLRAVSIVAAVPMAYGAVALLILPFAAPLSLGVSQVPLAMAHGVFIALSSIFLALGPRYITSAEVSLLVLGESIMAPLLVWLVLSEDPGPRALAGGGAVLGALMVSNTYVLLRNRSARKRH